MDISVIVPIYNVEKYIERCLRSLFEQTKIDNVEFVLVNDCTPDSSMAIARRVIGEYPHLTIKILEHAENRGVAAARQTGLDSAIGDYTIQIDSDDWCEHNMLEEMYAKAIEESADIVVCDLYENSGDSQRYVSQIVGADKYDTFKIMGGYSFVTALWNKLIKRSLYSINGIGFDKDVILCEDRLVLYKLVLCAENICHCPKAYYHYSKRGDSLTTTMNENMYKDLVIGLIRIEEFARVRHIYEDIRQVLHHKQAIMICNLYPLLNRDIQREMIVSFSDVSYIMREAQGVSIVNRAAYWFARHKCYSVANMIFVLRRYFKN